MGFFKDLWEGLKGNRRESETGTRNENAAENQKKTDEVLREQTGTTTTTQPQKEN